MPGVEPRKLKTTQKRVKKARKLAVPKGIERPITEMQKRFCEYLAQGHNQAKALKLAGSVEGEPLQRVHRCVFGISAPESEVLDPRLYDPAWRRRHS